jgi:hypothetical protein
MRRVNRKKKLKKALCKAILLPILIFSLGSSMYAQVTFGSIIEPRRAALLDLKARQGATGTVSSVTDDDNITSALGDGGILLPRVKLVNVNTLEPFIPTTDPDYIADTDNLRERLAGLMVYNITDNGVGSTLYPAVYTWNGALWVTSQINKIISAITGQPAKFTFYELGTETTSPLVFTVDGLGAWTYQWYQVTGNNVHVRIGTPIGGTGTVSGTGATTASFTPSGVIKGTTRNANNAGFYRFYCIATSSLGAQLESDIAEVAVGCGAKNNAGEWLSFMCFNLGAQNGITIQGQKNYNIGTFTNTSANVHTYITGEENVWGSLFQWGRIADGHELRTVAAVARGTFTIASGSLCSGMSTAQPYQQVATSSTAFYGKYIYDSNIENWAIGAGNPDLLWRSGRFIQNDPCAHYKENGTYQPFWYTGGATDACTDTETSWRTPVQDEWGSLYKGESISGSAATATANTWVWYNGTTTNYSRGYEIKPDGVITTMFLPANGNRGNTDGRFYNQGQTGSYWSVSIIAANAYSLNFTAQGISPANNSFRASGYALRCIKSD